MGGEEIFFFLIPSSRIGSGPIPIQANEQPRGKPRLNNIVWTPTMNSCMI